MKVFAILTACLMAAGGATYYFASSGDGGCPFSRCPVATTGGCCAGDQATASAKPDCCQVPCPACSDDCGECCAVCEDCCVAGAGTIKFKAAKYATAANAKPSNCCLVGDDCCEKAAACCGDKADSPVSVATAAVLAGAGAK